MTHCSFHDKTFFTLFYFERRVVRDKGMRYEWDWVYDVKFTVDL